MPDAPQDLLGTLKRVGYLALLLGARPIHAAKESRESHATRQRDGERTEGEQLEDDDAGQRVVALRIDQGDKPERCEQRQPQDHPADPPSRPSQFVA